jgi:hypothetical protein
VHWQPTQQAADLERLKAQAASAGEKQALQQEIDNLKYQQFQETQNYQKAQLDYLSHKFYVVMQQLLVQLKYNMHQHQV